MKRTLCVIAVVLLSSVLHAQSPNQQPAATAATAQPTEQTAEMPRFVSGSRLVLVPVLVRDKKNNHISGLGKDAFVIEENGKSQKVSVFEEANTEKAAIKGKTSVSEGHSNFTLSGDSEWRLTIVLLDLVNTPYMGQRDARKSLMNYLSQSITRDEPTTLLGLSRSGLRQLHPFTTDTAVLIAALKNVAGEVQPEGMNNASKALDDFQGASNEEVHGLSNDLLQLMKDSEARMAGFYQRNATETTLVAMEQIANAYSAIPGRKTLIWASGGFPFMLDDPDTLGRRGTDLFEAYERTWRALASANIVIYPVDLNGLLPSSFFSASNRGGSMFKIQYDKPMQQQDTLRASADATGGRACLNANDLERCFATAVEDSRAYYLLGYYVGSDDRKPGWRKLKVKVAADGAQVRGREGFYFSADVPDTPETRRKQILEALASPLAYTGVRMSVRQVQPNDRQTATSGGHKTEFMIAIPGDSVQIDGNSMNLDLVAAAFDGHGQQVDFAASNIMTKLRPEQVQRIRQGPVGATQQLQLPPGKYEVRFVVRDNLNGKLGTASIPVEVK